MPKDIWWPAPGANGKGKPPGAARSPHADELEELKRQIETARQHEPPRQQRPAKVIFMSDYLEAKKRLIARGETTKPGDIRREIRKERERQRRRDDAKRNSRNI